jgi:hypothetical protein
VSPAPSSVSNLWVIGANTFAYRFQFFGINGEMNGIGMDGIS